MKEYFGIKDWTVWNGFGEEITEMERCELFMSYYKNITPDEVRDLNKNTLMKEYGELVDVFEKTSAPAFYPIIEIDGVLHGFVDITQMSLGEYVDLEKLTKYPKENLAQIMAILYRPITKHKFNSLKFKVINTYNTFSNNGKMVNIWDYYEVEPYNYSNSVVVAERMAHFPVAFALGALSFFLLQISLVNQSSLLYSQMNQKEKLKMNWSNQMKKLIPKNTINIGDGMQQFVIWRKLPSLTSQGISVSQI